MCINPRDRKTLTLTLSRRERESVIPSPIRRQKASGSGLMEILVVMGIVSIVVLVVTTLFMSSSTQMARAVNYYDMNAASQMAMDKLSRDIRNANGVTACGDRSANIFALEFEDEDGDALEYIYNRSNKTLSRVIGKTNKKGKPWKGARTEVLLRECESLTVSLGKRHPSGGFDAVPNSSAAECKVINVSWKCARSLLGQKTHENMSTGQIVLRRQRT